MRRSLGWLVLITLTQTLQLKARYLQQRGRVFWFILRVPADLIERYGKKVIRESLRTTDQQDAIREGNRRYLTYQAKFKALRGNEALTASELLKSAQALVDEWGDLDLFVEKVIEPKLHQHIKAQELPEEVDSYHLVQEKDYLTPSQVKALELFKRGAQARRLSHIFDSYKRTHPKANKENFVLKEGREWQKLVDLVGDIPVEDLNRGHAHSFIADQLGKGNKTSTVRRSLNSLNAILNEGIRELGLKVVNPFAEIRIQGEGEDAKEIKVPTPEELAGIVSKFKNDTTATALIILIQMATGARVGEISGLAVSDVVLNHAIPHLTIRPQPWRSLKTKASIREVPLVGLALEAAKTAVKLAGASKGLFPQYAKERGNDSASQAVNKRLAQWGITSHGFRHAIKDLLREVGCHKDIRDAIQGHAARDIADQYGKGHTLKTMAEWLTKAEDLITQHHQREHNGN